MIHTEACGKESLSDLIIDPPSAFGQTWICGYRRSGAYVARGEARAAFRRAFDAQSAVYTGKPPTA